MYFLYFSFFTLCLGVSLPDIYHSFFSTLIPKPARVNFTAIVLVANGTEELEAVTTIDLLRRANMTVEVAGVEGPEAVTCKYGCVLTPDTSLRKALQQTLYDLVMVPGGEQACNLMAQSDDVGRLLSEHVKGERFIAATTAGPIVLDAHKINYLQRLTSAPEFSGKLKKHYSYYDWEETIVDIPGRMITGRFSSSILEFGLSIINHVAGRTAAEAVSQGLQPYSSV